MGLGAGSLGNQRISRFMDAVVDEGVGAFRAFHQFLANGLPQHPVNLGLGKPQHGGKHLEPGDVAKTGQLLQRPLRLVRQARQLAHHQVHDIVGVTLGMDAIRVPAPMPGVMVEGQQVLFGQGLEKLDHEERIAGGLVLH
ncbi:hypothetical protein D9M69_575930 [compost metagenome]